MFGAEPMYHLSPEEFRKRCGLDVAPAVNVRAVSEIPCGLVPFAVVTPEGKWFDRKDHEDNASWMAKVKELFGVYRHT
jgi:hypothetical protein